MIRSYFAGGSLIALAAAAALAQPGASYAATAPQGASSLDEVVVVARRTEERLQDVPISVTALTQESLQQANVSNSTDLIKLVPTLNVQQGATGPGTNYSLRGIRTGVITYFNEVPTASAGLDDQIWDLSSVQALQGPQGTLFGRNSTGGAILFVPQRPTDKLEGYVQGKLGDYAYREALGVINIPVSDTLKIRAGGRIVRRDPVVENWRGGSDFQSLKREEARLSILFKPTDTISNYTVIDYSHRDELPFALIASGFVRTAGCNLLPGGACLPGYSPGLIARLGDAQEARGIRSTSSLLPAYSWLKTSGVSNIFTWSPTQSLTFKYVAGYRTRKSEEGSDKANFELPLEYGRNQIFGVDDWSHEFQLQGKLKDRLNWTVGYFLSGSDSDGGLEYALFLPPGTQPRATNSTDNQGRSKPKSKAAFAQGTLALTRAWNLTAGVRYTEDQSTTVSSNKGLAFGFFGPQVCTLPRGAKGVDFNNCVRTLSGKWDAITYNVSTDYRINEKLLIYATTRRGYNAGGFNGVVPDSNAPGSPQTTYDPEYITDYEAGAKADWRIGDVPLRTNLSVFLGRYTDIQRSQRGFTGSGQPFQAIANGPRATIKGLQFESAVKPFPELTITFNYGHLLTRYDTGTDVFKKGNKFAQAPEDTVNLSAAYRHPIAPGGDLTASANYTYQSEINFQDDQQGLAAPFQKGYGIVDLRAGWEKVGGRPLDVVLFVKNATDESYAVERQDQTALFGFTGSVYNDPRTYGVEVKYSFGS